MTAPTVATAAVYICSELQANPFARVILNILQKLAERAHCGFQRARSTIDMLFSLRHLQEKCRKQQVSLYTAFIDLTKAFDLVGTSGLFHLLEKIGCPPKLLSIITAFQSNMKSTVRYDGAVSNAFPIKSGVLAPTLFGIFFSLVLSHAFRTSQYVICNLCRLPIFSHSIPTQKNYIFNIWSDIHNN